MAGGGPFCWLAQVRVRVGWFRSLAQAVRVKASTAHVATHSNPAARLMAGILPDPLPRCDRSSGNAPAVTVVSGRAGSRVIGPAWQRSAPITGARPTCGPPYGVRVSSAASSRPIDVIVPDQSGRDLLTGLPVGVRVEVWNGRGEPPESATTTRFWVPSFLGGRELHAAVQAMPRLEVVQLLSAGADAFVGQLPEQVTLCDARGVHTSSTSEWVIAALLATYRYLPRFVLAQAQGRWDRTATEELAGKRVLIVGAGAIGDGVRARLEPFDVHVSMVARRARGGIHAASELPRLLPDHDAVVVLLPLTESTRGMVDSEFLAAMPDGALLVNAARGQIVDTDALLAELTAGRLRAALDVTDPEPLPEGHPLWQAPGLLVTPHVGGAVPGFPARAYRLVGAQIGRFAAGTPLANIVSEGY